MCNERAILCGRVAEGAIPVNDSRPLRLWAWGPNRNVHLTIKDVNAATYREVSGRFRDLIDLAVYVYCADQAIKRGDDTFRDYGARWRRRLFFRIAVREPEFWGCPQVREQLTATLSFLSEDEYHFEFVPLRKDEPFQQYFDFGPETDVERIDEVVLFSGGIDSLGGAIQEALLDKKHIALVHHRSSEKMLNRHRQLLQQLRKSPGVVRPAHFPVRINKHQRMNQEFTQRSRSFLYAALGATIAAMLGLRRVRFYENGVVSLNLPPLAQVVGARATRTTHPQVLRGFGQLFTAVAGKTFEVENPFAWKTKADVVRLIAEAGGGPLLGLSTSCTHTWVMTNAHPHCGVCSQCIDRRFAVLAAGQQDQDPADGYGVDLLLGERPEGQERTMLAAYLEMANQIDKMSLFQFFGHFGEASRVLRHVGGNAEATAQLVLDLYRRHARDVTGVIDRALAASAPALRKRELPMSCLLSMVAVPGGVPVNGTTVMPKAAADTTPASRATHSIRRKGKCWAIRFDSPEEKVYPPDIGFHYLHTLLEHPGTSWSAAKLDCDLRRSCKGNSSRRASVVDASAVDVLPTNGPAADDVLDAEGRENLNTRLAEVEETIAALQSCESPTRVDAIDDLEEEKEWITATLRQSRGHQGKKRKLGDERNRVRNRVCNAIRRALVQIKAYDPRLAEHLVKPVLNLGHTISYVPRDGTSWSTSSDSNR